jgi:hypothetical protein
MAAARLRNVNERSGWQKVVEEVRDPGCDQRHDVRLQARQNRLPYRLKVEHLNLSLLLQGSA